MNQIGNSLVSVLMAAAISGAIALGVMRLSKNQTDLSISGQSNFNELFLKNIANTILFNNNHCTASLSLDQDGDPYTFNRIDANESTDPGIAVGLYFANNAGERLQKKLSAIASEPQSQIDKLEIQDMRVYFPTNVPAESLGVNDNFPNDSLASYEASLKIVYNKSTGTNTERNKSIEFPLMLSIQTDSEGNSSIINCQMIPGGGSGGGGGTPGGGYLNAKNSHEIGSLLDGYAIRPRACPHGFAMIGYTKSRAWGNRNPLRGITMVCAPLNSETLDSDHTQPVNTMYATAWEAEVDLAELDNCAANDVVTGVRAEVGDSGANRLFKVTFKCNHYDWSVDSNTLTNPIGGQLPRTDVAEANCDPHTAIRIIEFYENTGLGLAAVSKPINGMRIHCW